MGWKSFLLDQSTPVSIRLKNQALQLLQYGFAVADQAVALPCTDNAVRRKGPGFFPGSCNGDAEGDSLGLLFPLSTVAYLLMLFAKQERRWQRN